MLKVGAAAHCGADAIAGVVNFTLTEIPNGPTFRFPYGNTSDKAASVGAFNDSYDTTRHSARGRFLPCSLTKKF